MIDLHLRPSRRSMRSLLLHFSCISLLVPHLISAQTPRETDDNQFERHCLQGVPTPQSGSFPVFRLEQNTPTAGSDPPSPLQQYQTCFPPPPTSSQGQTGAASTAPPSDPNIQQQCCDNAKHLNFCATALNLKHSTFLTSYSPPPATNQKQQIEQQCHYSFRFFKQESNLKLDLWLQGIKQKSTGQSTMSTGGANGGPDQQQMDLATLENASKDEKLKQALKLGVESMITAEMFPITGQPLDMTGDNPSGTAGTTTTQHKNPKFNVTADTLSVVRACETCVPFLIYNYTVTSNSDFDAVNIFENFNNRYAGGPYMSKLEMSNNWRNQIKYTVNQHLVQQQGTTGQDGSSNTQPSDFEVEQLSLTESYDMGTQQSVCGQYWRISNTVLDNQIGVHGHCFFAHCDTIFEEAKWNSAPLQYFDFNYESFSPSARLYHECLQVQDSWDDRDPVGTHRMDFAVQFVASDQGQEKRQLENSCCSYLSPIMQCLKRNCPDFSDSDSSHGRKLFQASGMRREINFPAPRSSNDDSQPHESRRLVGSSWSSLATTYEKINREQLQKGTSTPRALQGTNADFSSPAPPTKRAVTNPIFSLNHHLSNIEESCGVNLHSQKTSDRFFVTGSQLLYLSQRAWMVGAFGSTNGPPGEKRARFIAENVNGTNSFPMGIGFSNRSRGISGWLGSTSGTTTPGMGNSSSSSGAASSTGSGAFYTISASTGDAAAGTTGTTPTRNLKVSDSKFFYEFYLKKYIANTVLRLWNYTEDRTTGNSDFFPIELQITDLRNITTLEDNWIRMQVESFQEQQQDDKNQEQQTTWWENQFDKEHVFNLTFTFRLGPFRTEEHAMSFRENFLKQKLFLGNTQLDYGNSGGLFQNAKGNSANAGQAAFYMTSVRSQDTPGRVVYGIADNYWHLDYRHAELLRNNELRIEKVSNQFPEHLNCMAENCVYEQNEDIPARNVFAHTRLGEYRQCFSTSSSANSAAGTTTVNSIVGSNGDSSTTTSSALLSFKNECCQQLPVAKIGYCAARQCSTGGTNQHTFTAEQTAIEQSCSAIANPFKEIETGLDLHLEATFQLVSVMGPASIGDSESSPPPSGKAPPQEEKRRKMTEQTSEIRALSSSSTGGFTPIFLQKFLQPKTGEAEKLVRESFVNTMREFFPQSFSNSNNFDETAMNRLFTVRVILVPSNSGDSGSASSPSPSSNDYKRSFVVTIHLKNFWPPAASDYFFGTEEWKIEEKFEQKLEQAIRNSGLQSTTNSVGDAQQDATSPTSPAPPSYNYYILPASDPEDFFLRFRYEPRMNGNPSLSTNRQFTTCFDKICDKTGTLAYREFSAPPNFDLLSCTSPERFTADVCCATWRRLGVCSAQNCAGRDHSGNNPDPMYKQIFEDGYATEKCGLDMNFAKKDYLRDPEVVYQLKFSLTYQLHSPDKPRAWWESVANPTGNANGHDQIGQDAENLKNRKKLIANNFYQYLKLKLDKEIFNGDFSAREMKIHFNTSLALLHLDLSDQPVEVFSSTTGSSSAGQSSGSNGPVAPSLNVNITVEFAFGEFKTREHAGSFLENTWNAKVRDFETKGISGAVVLPGGSDGGGGSGSESGQADENKFTPTEEGIIRSNLFLTKHTNGQFGFLSDVVSGTSLASVNAGAAASQDPNKRRELPESSEESSSSPPPGRPADELSGATSTFTTSTSMGPVFAVSDASVEIITTRLVPLRITTTTTPPPVIAASSSSSSTTLPPAYCGPAPTISHFIDSSAASMLVMHDKPTDPNQVEISCKGPEFVPQQTVVISGQNNAVAKLVCDQEGREWMLRGTAAGGSSSSPQLENLCRRAASCGLTNAAGTSNSSPTGGAPGVGSTTAASSVFQTSTTIDCSGSSSSSPSSGKEEGASTSTEQANTYPTGMQCAATCPTGYDIWNGDAGKVSSVSFPVTCVDGVFTAAGSAAAVSSTTTSAGEGSATSPSSETPSTNNAGCIKEGAVGEVISSTSVTINFELQQTETLVKEFLQIGPVGAAAMLAPEVSTSSPTSGTIEGYESSITTSVDSTSPASSAPSQQEPASPALDTNLLTRDPIMRSAYRKAFLALLPNGMLRMQQQAGQGEARSLTSELSIRTSSSSSSAQSPTYDTIAVRAPVEIVPNQHSTSSTASSTKTFQVSFEVRTRGDLKSTRAQTVRNHLISMASSFSSSAEITPSVRSAFVNELHRHRADVLGLGPAESSSQVVVPASVRRELATVTTSAQQADFLQSFSLNTETIRFTANAIVTKNEWGFVVDDSSTTTDGARTTASQSTQEHDLQPGAWDTCSNLCGKGIQARIGLLVCGNANDGDECDQTTKPEIEQNCKNYNNCSFLDCPLHSEDSFSCADQAMILKSSIFAVIALFWLCASVYCYYGCKKPKKGKQNLTLELEKHTKLNTHWKIMMDEKTGKRKIIWDYDQQEVVKAATFEVKVDDTTTSPVKAVDLAERKSVTSTSKPIDKTSEISTAVSSEQNPTNRPPACYSAGEKVEYWSQRFGTYVPASILATTSSSAATSTTATTVSQSIQTAGVVDVLIQGKQVKRSCPITKLRIPLRVGELCQVCVEMEESGKNVQDHNKTLEESTTEIVPSSKEQPAPTQFSASSDTTLSSNKSLSWIGPCVVEKALPGFRGYIVKLPPKKMQPKPFRVDATRIRRYFEKNTEVVYALADDVERTTSNSNSNIFNASTGTAQDDQAHAFKAFSKWQVATVTTSMAKKTAVEKQKSSSSIAFTATSKPRLLRSEHTLLSYFPQPVAEKGNNSSGANSSSESLDASTTGAAMNNYTSRSRSASKQSIGMVSSSGSSSSASFTAAGGERKDSFDGDLGDMKGEEQVASRVEWLMVETQRPVVPNNSSSATLGSPTEMVKESALIPLCHEKAIVLPRAVAETTCNYAMPVVS
ncbi:unnamed protein product [Amoebophrya sp. A120]|nr:unnamed protein product [Amoebophrya sp. A120]|eukprot:GSA120T00006921001.1